MTTSAKVAAKPTTKSAVKAAAQTAAQAEKSAQQGDSSEPAASSEPYLRFHHSTELRQKTEGVLAALEASPDDARHGDALADLVAELTAAGMDFYFLKPLKLAQVGFVTEQSARLGLAGAVKLISSVSRKFIVRMDKGQLLIVAAHIRSLAR